MNYWLLKKNKKKNGMPYLSYYTYFRGTNDQDPKISQKINWIILQLIIMKKQVLLLYTAYIFSYK